MLVHNRIAKSGKRKDLGNIFFRSSWEANWARYLNYQKKTGIITKWEYEPETFEFTNIKRGTRFYTPDFKVYYHNIIEYQEIKGFMDSVSKTKMRRMSKYYPDIPIKLIDRKLYSSVAMLMGPVLKGWEKTKSGKYV